MNLSMLPLYGSKFIAKKIRKISDLLNQSAEFIEINALLTKQQISILKRNKIFLNKHKGRPAFVIANGPSLSGQDLSHLKDQITFVCSGFWKHEQVLKWQPTYYSLTDHHFFNGSKETHEFYESLTKRIHSSTFFLPLYRGFDAMSRYGYLSNMDKYYVASLGYNRLENDLTGIVQGYGSVSAFSLGLAIYMGCSPIYLLGFDHDYLANRGKDRHFYEGGTISGHHLVNVEMSERIPYDDEMRANLGLWANYRSLKAIAKNKNIDIFNCTAGGYLDVFPRFEYGGIWRADDGN